MIRCLVGVVLLCFSASAVALDPIMLLLLRMLRDKAISTSLESGYNSLREQEASTTIPSPVYGFALPTPPIPKGGEEARVRTLIDESFLHLSAAQRQAVFAGMQNILNDPWYAQMKPQIVAEFELKANAVRVSYVSLSKLSPAEKKALVAQAKEEFRQMNESDRHHLLEMLHAGTLPVPRDLSESMLAEFRSMDRNAGPARRRE